MYGTLTTPKIYYKVNLVTRKPHKRITASSDRPQPVQEVEEVPSSATSRTLAVRMAVFSLKITRTSHLIH